MSDANTVRESVSGEFYGRDIAVHIDQPDITDQFRVTLLVDGKARFAAYFTDKRES